MIGAFLVGGGVLLLVLAVVNYVEGLYDQGPQRQGPQSGRDGRDNSAES